jgi:hypothetical protein
MRLQLLLAAQLFHSAVPMQECTSDTMSPEVLPQERLLGVSSTVPGAQDAIQYARVKPYNPESCCRRGCWAKTPQCQVHWTLCKSKVVSPKVLSQEKLLAENSTVPGALDAIQLHHATGMPRPFLFVAVLTTTSTLARRQASKCVLRCSACLQAPSSRTIQAERICCILAKAAERGKSCMMQGGSQGHMDAGCREEWRAGTFHSD